MSLLALMSALGLLLLFDGLTGPPRHRGGSLFRSLDCLVQEAGIGIRRGRTLILLSVGIALITFVLATGITSSLVVGLVLGVAASWWPIAYARNRRNRRRKRFRAAWPDAIASLIASVRAGVSLAEGCDACVDRGPTELREGFEAFRATYRSSGSFTAGIDSMRARLADPIADRVAISLLIAHEVGGTDLVRVLRALSDFIREDLRVRKEIEARWSWTVTAARLAAAAPWIVLLLMASRPEGARAYGTPSGATVVLAGTAATMAGYRLMLRAARLPEERRLTT